MMNPAEFANIAKAEEQFWWYRGMRRIMFGLFDPLFAHRRYRRILEAGCGTGHFAKVLRERYRVPIVALDLGWEGLEYGRHLGIPELAQGDIQELPFRARSFDLLVSMDVVVHLPRGDEHRAFAEFARVLEPGGTLAMRVSALDWLRSRHSEFALERQRFTRTRLVRAAEAHGFHVDRCTYANSLLLPVAFTKFRIVEPLMQSPPDSGVQPVSSWLDRLLSLPLQLESRWIAAGLDFPLGQSLILLATLRS
ncbi:MAG: class I SAM-dependent methyltransferase [Bryobacteraceae bacterium]